MTDKELHRLKRYDLIQLLLMEVERNQELRKEVEVLAAEKQELELTEVHLKERLNDKDEQRDRLTEKLNDKDEQIERLKEKLDDKDGQMENFIMKLNEKDEQLEHLKRRLDDKDSKISALKGEK